MLRLLVTDGGLTSEISNPHPTRIREAKMSCCRDRRPRRDHRKYLGRSPRARQLRHVRDLPPRTARSIPTMLRQLWTPRSTRQVIEATLTRWQVRTCPRHRSLPRGAAISCHLMSAAPRRHCRPRSSGDLQRITKSAVTTAMAHPGARLRSLYAYGRSSHSTIWSLHGCRICGALPGAKSAWRVRLARCA